MGSPPRRPGGLDYRITEADQIGVGGAKQKYRDNIAAIRLLRQLEAEGRKATAEEQAILVRYVGWGGLSQVFDASNEWRKDSNWKKEYLEMKDLLTDEEYETARGSTLNAHYTSPKVIDAMWKAVERMGFEGGRVLEPATGVGHFFGAMPEHLADNTQKIGTELDHLTGGIAQQLYQNANIQVTGFESSNLPSNFVDLAISNVPFGNYPVHDPKYKRSKKFLTRSIHNYFFAESLDKVKPGGVVAFVTSRFTMDSKNSQVRDYLASQADLVGAIRLPNTAFKENAMTDVTTDILFLRKRAEGETDSGTGWSEAIQMTDDEDKEYHLNEYFVNNPDMMLGEMKVTGNFYRSSADLVPQEGQDLEAALSKAIATLPEGVAFNATPDTNYPDTISQPPPFYKTPSTVASDIIRPGVVFVDETDGKVYRRGRYTDEYIDKSTWQSETAVAKIAGIGRIREKAKAVLEANHAGVDDAELASLQADLNVVYDEFVSEHGYLSQRTNKKFLADIDPDRPFLLSLEHYDDEEDTAEKASIFNKRVVGAQAPPETAETAHDALMISLNEVGKIHWKRMTELTGRDEALLREELDEVIYRTPAGDWELADEYLSGNVRQKLKEARTAAQFDSRYERNVEALEAVVPADIQSHQIQTRLGVGWVDPKTVAQFIDELLEVEGVEVRYAEEMGQWFINDKNAYGLRYSTANYSTYGTSELDALTLIEKNLNSQMAVVKDRIEGADGKRKYVENAEKTIAAQEMQDKINQKFNEWLWQDEDRANRLLEHYNDTFNATVPRQYDGSHLTMPGLASDLTMRPHQKDSIWRMVQGGNTLLAHQVGAGKTFAMIGAGMEMKRLGLRNKVLHVVKNHMLDQYAADFQRMYPGANILVIPSKHLSKKKRQEALSRIATEDWDAIITSHSAMGRIDVKDETFNKLLREEIDVLTDYLNDPDLNDDKRTVKQIENQIKRLTAKLRDSRNQDSKDAEGLKWEDLGVDQLFVDEAHEFKNLFFPTRRTQMAGVASRPSNKSFDLFVKTRSMSDKDNASVVFATGTPIANSVGEMYTMQRYLQLSELQRQGLAHFDAWANQYGDTVTNLEMKPSGEGYKMKTRFARFNNVPELLRMFHSVADVQMDSDALGIKRPDLATGKPIPVTVSSSPELETFIKEAARRAENLANVDPKEDNMLNIVTDAAKAALDMRLIDPTLPDDPNSKVNRVVENVLDIYDRTTGMYVEGYDEPQNMAQAVFLDLSVPGSKEFTVYDDMKKKLIDGGIPEHEIAFAHDAKNDEQKKALFDRVNSGSVRVIIGTSEKMGTGTNMQKRLYALHDVDAPWKPATVEQRLGRILRQGNMNTEVEVYRYVTERSFDVYRWQILEMKARFISQVMTGTLDDRSIGDVDEATLTFAEMKAIATGNPVLIKILETENKLSRLEALYSSYKARDDELAQKVAVLPGRIKTTKERAQSLDEVIQRYQQDSRALDKLGQSLANEVEADKFTTTPRKVSEVYGAAVSVFTTNDGRKRAKIRIDDGTELEMGLRNSEKWNTGRLNDLFGSLDKKKDALYGRAAEMEKQLADSSSQVGKPFEQEAELKSLRADLAELQAKLDALADSDDWDDDWDDDKPKS